MTSTHVHRHVSDPAPADLARHGPEGFRPARMPRRTAFWAVAVGCLAFVISWLGSWVPSFWGGEAAAIMSARRSWGSLLDELGNVDAGHGLFYALLHVWIEFFGTSPLATRTPSAIAVGLAAAGILVLVRSHGGLRLGILAALVFAVLPGTTYLGGEVGPYALGTACGVWLAVLFLRLVARGNRQVMPWVAFALAFAASMYVSLWLCLLVLPFAAVILAAGAPLATPLRRVSGVASDTAARRAPVVHWMLATVVAAVLVAPLCWLVLHERAAPARPALGVGLMDQWFGSSWALAVVTSAALVALVVAWAIAWKRGRPGTVPGAERARLNVLAVAWLVLPPAALLAVNAVVPMGTGHPLSFVTPAIAILLAAAVDAAAGWTVGRVRAPRRAGSGAVVGTAPRGWLRPVASLLGVALVAAIAMPAYLAQRSPFAKDGGSDWAQVAAIVQRHATPGDDIVFDETTRPSRRPRLAMHVYPQQFADVVDVTLDVPYTNVAGLWDTTYGIRRVGSRIDDGDGRVWLVEYLGPDERGVVDSTGMHERLAALRALGFTVADSYRLHRDVVYLVKRGTTS